ncbi:tyrosine-type recombinase/integrase [Streptomyces microflavus]|uniref:tyrosine-type recombinase/integrase n=1 Tax=Streptomyces microflavus TaxID=1919 RepID=UPI0038004A94
MARRNANGEGTIYRRKDGRYEGAVYVLTTSGTQKRVRVYGATRAEVHGKLTEAKAKDQQGIPAADKAWKLGDYLDYWLAEVVKPNRRPTTYELYEINVRLYIKPALGAVPLARLTVPLVQRFLNQRLADGLSVRKVQMLRETLSPALTRAMREEIVSRNVAMLVELPGKQETDIVPWTPQEIIRFVTAAGSHKWFPAFLLVALYGLRRAEAIGLRWQDIDFANKVIHVRQQVFRANGEVQQGPVKTHAGRRDLPLLDAISARLIKHQEEYGYLSQDTGLVFTTSTGRMIEPYNFTRAFQAILSRHSIRRIKLHHVRHTAATILKNLGIPARDVQLILGHSDIAITQQIYQHDTMDSRREALKLMEGVAVETQQTDKSESLEAVVAVVDGNGSRQVSRQTQKMAALGDQFSEEPKKSPRLRGDFSWLGWRDSNPRMLVPELGARREATLYGVRVTEVRRAMDVQVRMWTLGIVAVSVAVNDTRVEDVDLAT